MREIADRARIEAFLEALAREATEDTDVFVVGGSSAVLAGWRDSTIDVDLVMRPESDAMLRAMLERGLVSAAELRRMFTAIEPQLYRYPAVDPPSFRRAVEEIVAP